MRLSIGLVAVAVSACAAPSRHALDYRNKARERFIAGDYGIAVADYDEARKIDRKGRIKGIAGERERAAIEYFRQQLKNAFAEYYKGNHLDAHKILVSLKIGTPPVFGLDKSKWEKILNQALEDTASQIWVTKVDPGISVPPGKVQPNRHYVHSFIIGEYLVEHLRPDHPLRDKLKAIQNMGIAYHLAKMRQVKDSHPAWAAFHYMLAQRLGGPPDGDGATLLAHVKGGLRGDPDTLEADAERAGQARDSNKMMDLYMTARAVSGNWASKAAAQLGANMGELLYEQDLLNEIWDVKKAYRPNDMQTPTAMALPDDDNIDPPITILGDDSNQPRTMDFYYGAGLHVASNNSAGMAKVYGTNIGAAIRIPSKKQKIAYELDGYLESDTLGGGSRGYGVEATLSKMVYEPVVAAVGIGYSENEVGVDPIMDPLGTMSFRQRNLYVPIIARAPLYQGYSASVEFRPNLAGSVLKDDDTTTTEEHLSPLTARVWGPIPLLSEPIKFLRYFTLELNASYVKGAPQETVYGGRLLFRRSLNAKGGDEDIKDSVFAIQTLIGPTIDLYYEFGRNFLLKENNAFGVTNTDEAGMGAILRVPGKDGSGVDLAFWFHTSGLGGNTGGWGLEYVALKAAGKKTPLVIGYGIGYMSDSVSDYSSGTMSPTAPSEMKHSSFHSPFILRFPLGATVIAAVEARVNWLQIKGSGNATANCVTAGMTDPEMGCQYRHFSPIGARIWMPIPILGDAIDIIKKFHLEGHITYWYGAKDEDLYGNRPLVYGMRLVWRPIQSKR